MNQRIDKTMSFAAANVWALILGIPALAVFLVPYWLLWRGSSAVDRFLLISLDGRFSFLFIIPIFAASIVVHELLHAVGFIWGGATWRDVKFGFKSFTPFAHCKVPLSVSSYRLAIALPGLILGIMPGSIGVATGNLGLTLYGAFMFMAAMGDALILWLLRDAPGTAKVIDHPSEVGCILIV